MQGVISYIKESYQELINKVEWPERNVLITSTVAVIVGLAIFSLIVLIMDIGANSLMKFIYKI